MSFIENLKIEDQLLEQTGFNPYYHIIESALDDTIIVEGKPFINLASNNYLGLANDPRIKKAMIEGLEKHGTSMCATPIASGYSDLFRTVQHKLALFCGVEDVLLFPSCYQANNGLFNAIVKKEDVIIVDQFAHSSLIEGIKSTGCKIRPFLHNNLDSLKTNLENSKGNRQIFVVTESVFSTEGSIAPFHDINAMCIKYNALPIVDDSHGIGILGTNGKGVLSEFNISDFNGIYTASVGKAIANSGGIIGGKNKLINYLKYYCSHYVYSTVLPPVIVAGIDKTIDIIQKDFTNLFKRLNENNLILKDGLKDKFLLTDSQSPITSVICGTSEQTFLFAKYLFENKILSTPFVFPSVSKNKGVIRLIAGANLKRETVDKAVDIINKYEQQSES
jgi:7-keto-8-aminopelargonate synthetase-like enzyme